MQPKKITIEEIIYTVNATKKQDVPLAYLIKAVHPNGKTIHESSLTIGPIDPASAPSLENVQAALDKAREVGAQQCHAAFKMAEIAKQLV